MRTEIDLGNNIFSIDVGYLWSISRGKLWMIYSPLAACELLVSTQQMLMIREQLASKTKTELTCRLLDQDKRKKKLIKADKHEEFSSLYVIPTNNCNFHCSYCYSASIRNGQVLSESSMIAGIDFFLATRETSDPLKIVFVGGGEPLLEWNLVSKGIRHIRENVQKRNGRIGICIITNLSQIDEEKIHFFRENDIQITASFDMLEDVQNRQRGHFQMAADALRRLDGGAVRYQIQATIMPDTIHRMPEMVENVAANYKNVQGVIFEMVRGGEFFKTARSMTSYIKRFACAWKQAEEVAEREGLQIFNAFFSAKNIVRKRYCSGICVLNPNDEISLCVHVGNSKQNGHRDLCVGRVNAGKVAIDKYALDRAYCSPISDDSKCGRCWAKWNCGGGCANAKFMYSQSVLKSICRNTKSQLILGLIDNLRKSYSKCHGLDLDEYVISQYKG